MSFDHHVLLWLLGLPLLSAVVVWCLGPTRGPAVRFVSLVSSLAVFALAAVLAGRFMAVQRAEKAIDPATKIATFVPEFVPGSTTDNPHATTWDLLPIGNGNVQFFVGIDGLNIWLIVLTATLMLPSVLVSFRQVSERVNEFYAWLLALQTCMIGVFLAFDIVLFYVFFEVSLIPLFFLIGIWGGSQRQYAARKFFIYTLAGSLITLLGVLGVVIACYTHTSHLTFSIPQLVTDVHTYLDPKQPEKVRSFFSAVQMWTFSAMAVGFAVKVPLMPFHTWLPLAHVEAPTAGSVDLAGVLLKIGSYGFLRLCIPLAPDFSLSHGLTLVTWLAALGVVYGALCAFSQDDVKRLIAYSSVSHLGLCMLGMFSLTAVGIQGSLMQMINHGLSTAALFLLIGMLYERYHTRQLKDYSGMAAKMPLFGVCLVFAALSSVGLPGLNGFIGEFLCLAGIYQHEVQWNDRRVLPVLTVLGASTLVLGAWYLFTMLKKVLFSSLHEPAHEGEPITDLTPREWGLLTPIFVLCVVIGFYPGPVMKTAEPDVDRIATIVEAARQRAGKVPENPLPPGAVAAQER